MGRRGQISVHWMDIWTLSIAWQKNVASKTALVKRVPHGFSKYANFKKKCASGKLAGLINSVSVLQIGTHLLINFRVNIVYRKRCDSFCGKLCFRL